MEALGAFALAVNIIQVIDFSAKLLRETQELHRLSTGHTAEHIELQSISQSLSKMCDSIPSPSNSQQQVGLVEHEISQIAASAKAAAQELMTVIDSLKLNHGPKHQWRTFRQAMATMWKKDEIERLQGRLEHLRDQLQLNLTTHVSLVQNRIVKTLDTLQRDFKQMSSPRADLIPDLIVRLEGMTLRTSEKADLEMTERALIEFRTTQDIYEKERRILDSLRFEAMFDRYHTITEAHETTFDWIFQPENFSDSDPRSTIAFKTWLLTGEGVYWVSGKPGSGKSTLMRHLSGCASTQQFLKSWAGDSRLITASFYFWMAGTPLQRSQMGLMRQLLFEILRENPDLIPDICPQPWTSTSYNTSVDWQLDQLHDALNRLEGIGTGMKICFFVDGLDEYDGDHLDLSKVIQKISAINNAKLCVSSRRWPVFEDAFGVNPRNKLYLEDLTRHDIGRFTQDKLDESPRFKALKLETSMYVRLVEEITRRAEGVFLWVFLVVRSLREGLSNGDSIDLLQQRLDEIPSDLEKFFEKIIRSVEPVYRKQMAVVFQIALRAPDSLYLLTYLFLDEPALYTLGSSKMTLTHTEYERQEKLMIRRLQGRYKGLLEATGKPGHSTVVFIHRTIRDYLTTKEGLDMFTQTGLNPFSKACRALLASLATHALMRASIPADPTVRNFIIFARWAEIENEPLEFGLVHEMFNQTNNDFLDMAVQYGYVSGLRYLLPKEPRSFLINGPRMIKIACRPQDNLVQKYFGLQSATDALTWTLRNLTASHTKEEANNNLVDFITGRYRGEGAEDMKQWKNSLGVFLQQGAVINEMFLNPRLLMCTPSNQYDPIFSFDPFFQHSGKSLEVFGHDLEILVDIHAALLEYGLNPNMRIRNCSIWQYWLWHTCESQLSNGEFDHDFARMMEAFLHYGANPYETVELSSDRLDDLYHPYGPGSIGLGTYFQGNRPRDDKLSVSFIIGGFFDEDQRDLLEGVLASAIERWRNKHPSGRSLEVTRPKRAFESNRDNHHVFNDSGLNESKRRRR